MRREAEKEKWRFVWRIGVLGWGFVMVCATDIWFYLLTRCSLLTITVVSLLVWLPTGAIAGIVAWNRALKTDAERREFWRHQKERGKPSFVWRYGVLRWGAPMFLVFTALCFLTLRSLPLAIIGSNLLFFLFGGMVFGAEALVSIGKEISMKISRLNTTSSREQLIALDVVRLSQDKHCGQIVYFSTVRKMTFEIPLMPCKA